MSGQVLYGNEQEKQTKYKTFINLIFIKNETK